MERLGLANSAPEIIERPEVAKEVDEVDGGGDKTWIVTVFDNNTNTHDEVIHILMVATGCDAEEAEMETWEIDNLGKSVVHYADRPECEGVAAVIAQIGIEVQVSEH